MHDERFFCQHSELCKTLANAKRQMILAALRDGERTVGEIQAETGIPQATLSQHLAVLRAHGVVVTRRSGPNVWYHIASTKIIQAFDLITEAMREITESQRAAATPRSTEDQVPPDRQ